MPETARAEKAEKEAPTRRRSSGKASGGGGGGGPPAPDLGVGTAVPGDLRSTAESLYGHSLGHVTLHTGSQADSFVRSQGARATTEGTRVALSSNYRPGTLEGDAIVAHELAHVIQQGAPATHGTGAPATPVAATPGPSFAEHEADSAAASVLARSGQHASSIQARTGMAPSQVAKSVSTPRLTRGLGLRLQRCTSEPEYGLSEKGPAPTEVAPTHGGARSEKIGPVGLFTYDDGYYRATLDGDGDQSAELALGIKGGNPDTSVLKRPQQVDVKATRLGNTPEHGGEGTETHSTSFDIRGLTVDASVRPILRERTDGRSPTRIAAARGSYVDWTSLDIHPPSPDGPQADYRMVFTRPKGYGDEKQSEEKTLSFKRDPNDIFPVFVPGLPRRAGSIWVLDTSMGRYGDKYRFTFRKPDPSGSAVRMGISPMAAGSPVGAEAVNLSVSGALNVAVVRVNGPVLQLDLNGDGKTDIQIFERFDPRSDETRGSSYPTPEQNRDLLLTVTNADGSSVLGISRRQVRKGEYDREAVHMEKEFDVVSAAATAEGLVKAAETPDLTSDLASVQKSLNTLRALAVERKLLSQDATTKYDALVTAWVGLTAASHADNTKARKTAAAAARAFHDVWIKETSAGTETKEHTHHGESWTETKNIYTGYYAVDGYQSGRLVTVKLPEELDKGNLTESSRLMVDLGVRVNNWVARRLKEGGLTKEAQQAEALVALSPLLDKLADKPDLKKVTAVFHSAPEFIAKGNPGSLPLRMYYWKSGTTWYLQDLTHPTREDSLGILSASVGAGETEPPDSLFQKLNDKKRYPKGFIQYVLPGEKGRPGTVRTTEPWTAADVLGWISLGLAGAALLAGAVLTGGAAAVAVPLLWTASAVVGAAGAAAEMIHESDQGRLTGPKIVLGVAQIVGSLAGAAVSGSRAIGAYRMIGASAAAAKAGTAAPTMAALMPVSTGALRILTITQVGADSVQLLLSGAELTKQIEAISKSGMSDGDKLRAYVFAIGSFTAMAGLTYVGIKGNIHELNTALAKPGARLIQAGEHTLVPGIHTEGDYVKELERQLTPDALGNMAPTKVKIVPPEEIGSSIGLARVEVTGGKPHLVVVDGAPLSAIREEALHLEQLALKNRSVADIKKMAAGNPALEAELLRTKQAATDLIDISQRWASASPADRIKAHKARLDLEEMGQRKLITDLQADIKAGKPVTAAEVDNAFQNLDNLRTKRADLVGAEAHVKSGGSLKDVDPQFNDIPALFKKKTVATTQIDESWRSLKKEEFVDAYSKRYPNSTLSPDELRIRYDMEQRLNPATGRLVDVNREVVDVAAKYKPGEEKFKIQGPGSTATAEDEKKVTKLLSARDQARAEREAAKAKVPPDVDAAHAAQYRMNEATRQLGEHAGEAWVKQRYATAEIIYPKAGAPSRSGDFDQVWKCTDKDGKTVYVVIEAKGGSADLGSRRVQPPPGETVGPRAEQGTGLYFEDILNSMFKAGDKGREAAVAIRKARADKVEVRYVHVSAPVETAAATAGGSSKSQAGQVSVKEFDITNGAPTSSVSGTVSPGGG